MKVGHRGPALLSMRAGAANTCAGAMRPIRVGFRSNGTMAGKIRWSMFVQGFTVLSSGTHAEMRAASGKLLPISSWTLAGKRPNSPYTVFMVAMSICQVCGIWRCYLETRTKLPPMVFTMKILLSVKLQPKCRPNTVRLGCHQDGTGAD